MKNRSQKQPQLFKKCVYNIAGLDNSSNAYWNDAVGLNDYKASR